MSPKDNLFIKPAEISSEQARKIEAVRFSNTRRSQIIELLVRVTVHNSKDYSLSPSTEQIPSVNIEDIRKFIDIYRKDPKDVLAPFRIALIHLVRDNNIPEERRKATLEEFTSHYLALIPLLDAIAFPPTGPDTIYEGIPAYIPDGLSDMGSNKEVDALKRSREKIRVNKEASHKLMESTLTEAVWSLKDTDYSPSSKEVKIFLTKFVMASVYNSMPYDYKQSAFTGTPRSIQIDEYVEAQSPASVCRHIAMETQLRLQALGLESRLLKCLMDGEPHVANLVRIEGQWYLIDTTNPEIDEKNPKQAKVYARPIALTDDPNQTWELSRNIRSDQEMTPRKVTYVSRNNMYYRLLDNKNSPVK